MNAKLWRLGLSKFVHVIWDQLNKVAFNVQNCYVIMFKNKKLEKCMTLVNHSNWRKKDTEAVFLVMCDPSVNEL